MCYSSYVYVLLTSRERRDERRREIRRDKRRYVLTSYPTLCLDFLPDIEYNI